MVLIMLAGDLELRRIASHAKHRLRDLADAAAILIIYSGPDGAALFVNRSWQHFTGDTSAQARGDGWVDSIHPDDRDLVLEAYWKAFQERVPFSAEVRLRRHDGVYRWMLDQGTPYFRRHGAFAGYMRCLTDVTTCHETISELEKQIHCSQALATACGVEYLLIDAAGHIDRQSRGCIYTAADQLPEAVRAGLRQASERRAAVRIETARTHWTITPILSSAGDTIALTAVLSETAPPV
jgi:PAS domain S-box-containing protein